MKKPDPKTWLNWLGLGFIFFVGAAMAYCNGAAGGF